MTPAPAVATPPLRPLCEIAAEIQRVWKRPYFGADPYLIAMRSLTTCNDRYGMEDGRSVVLYFLGNANTFRGPAARRIKAELKAHAGLRLKPAEAALLAAPAERSVQ